MKIKSFVLIILLSCVIFAFSTKYSLALSFSEGNATLLWNTWNLWTDGDLQINWEHSEDNIGVGVWNSLGDDDFMVDEIIPWGNISVSASVQGANADVLTSDSEINTSFLSKSETDNFWAESDAGASRYLGFEITEGAGNVYVSIDYSIAQNLNTDILGEKAEAYSWVGLYIGDDPNPGALPWPYLDDSILTNTVNDGISITDNKSGTLYGSFYFEYLPNGENYGKTFIEVGNFACAKSVETNPVPEPTTCLLLFIGLVGLIGVKKKFS